jgi:hypothetical protein
MIDQEGFRMIQPTFRLAGYSRPPALERGADLYLVSATADFMPAERKSFTFHHSSLDTPPVFRRLLVNSDGSHDYLSRQAYLILKANGPYTVQGTEPVQTQPVAFTTLSLLSLLGDSIISLGTEGQKPEESFLARKSSRLSVSPARQVYFSPPKQGRFVWCTW